MYIDQHLMTKCYERFHNRGRVSFGWEGFFGHNSAFILVAFRICEHKLEIQKTNVEKSQIRNPEHVLIASLEVSLETDRRFPLYRPN